MDTKTILSVQNLQVKFTLRGEILHAIRDISLDVYRGESLAIVENPFLPKPFWDSWIPTDIWTEGIFIIIQMNRIHRKKLILPLFRRKKSG